MVIELSVDGAVVETYEADLKHGTAPDSGSSSANYEFAIVGVKAAAAEIIKL